MTAATPERKALVTGITGQDGSYLAELLLEKGYEVHGIVRRSSSFNTDRIDHLYRDPHERGVRLFTHYGDLSDSVALTKLIYELQPDEIYHLGAQSHVRVSFDIPEYTFDVTGAGTLRLLDAIREAGAPARFYQASSSEMYGSAPPPQSETTRFHPRSPYAVAKVAAYWATVNYREAYGMFAANGILFNHESPRRGETFVTRKITRAARAHQGRPSGQALSRQPRGEARLGLRSGLRRGDVADASGCASRTTSWWPRARRTRCGSSWRPPSATPGSTGRGTWRSIRATSGPPRWTSCSATAQKPATRSAGRPTVGFDELVRIMVDADIAVLEDQLAGKVTRYSHES